MTSPRRINESGLCTVWSFDGDGRQFAQDVIAECTRCEYCLVLIFYSQQHYPPASFLEPLAEQLDGPIIAGCSSAGELTPEGLQENNIVAMLFPVIHFSADAELIEDVAACGMEDIVNRVALLRERFTGGDHDSVFAISVIDGLSRSEESVTTAINRALDGITLLGGSSGDDLLFTRTTQVFGNRNYSGAAIVVMLRTDLEFEAFSTKNFVATENKLVITDCDPSERIVYEFNGVRAAEEYARLINVDSACLSAATFASHPLVVRVGGEYFCRAISHVYDDGSMRFFCAIDEGVVLTLSEPVAMVETTAATLEGVTDRIGPLDTMLGFDCAYRRTDARNRGLYNAMSELYQAFNFVGFATYGEQFQAMHINQTCTGIAFAAPTQPTAAAAPTTAVDELASDRDGF
ncbi:MAG: FIST N-terminal domain-containing protein [Pseudomonadota bacterium]